MNKKPTLVSEHFATKATALQPLFAKIKHLTDIQSKLSPLLPTPLNASCQVANLIGHCLILITDSGATAMQIRFLTPDLLKQCKLDPTLKQINEIQCKVRPKNIAPKNARTSQKMAPLTSETAEMIHDIAKTIDDPKLKKALLKIAKHVE